MTLYLEMKEVVERKKKFSHLFDIYFFLLLIVDGQKKHNAKK